MRKIQAKVRAGIMIPLRQLDEGELEVIQRENTWSNYLDPFECKSCSEESVKPDNCADCPNYECHKFYQRKVIKGEPAIVIRKGYLTRLKKLMGKELKLVDKQSTTPMSTDKYRFNYKMLNPGQQKAHDDMVKAIESGKSGILKSPPRTGKTVMATSVILTLKRKTIFLAHQEDLLIGRGQLISTFLEKTKADAPVNPGKYFTNLAKYIQEGETPIKYCRTLEDFMETDICLTTYQVFLHPRGKKILQKIKSEFGLVVVDECHRTGSSKYSQILDQFTCPRMGLSATPKRKDGRHRIMHSVFGNIEHQTSIESLAPMVSVVRTGFASKKMYKNWVFFLRFLENTEKRINRILQFLKKDADNGRSILIPVAHHSQVDYLVEELGYMGVKAIGWDGRLKKKERHIPLEKSATGEVSVLVAQRSMLTGMNIPRWDMLYWIVPMNNDPNFEQEYKRVCTPMPGKPKPVVRFFVDDHEVVERCFFNCAKVIKDAGGEFTENAMKDWTQVGQRFGKLKAPTPKACKDKEKQTGNGNRRVKTTAKSLFGSDIEVDDEHIIDVTPKPVKKKTSHLSRRL